MSSGKNKVSPEQQKNKNSATSSRVVDSEQDGKHRETFIDEQLGDESQMSMPLVEGSKKTVTRKSPQKKPPPIIPTRKFPPGSPPKIDDREQSLEPIPQPTTEEIPQPLADPQTSTGTAVLKSIPTSKKSKTKEINIPRLTLPKIEKPEDSIEVLSSAETSPVKDTSPDMLDPESCLDTNPIISDPNSSNKNLSPTWKTTIRSPGKAIKQCFNALLPKKHSDDKDEKTSPSRSKSKKKSLSPRLEKSPVNDDCVIGTHEKKKPKKKPKKEGTPIEEKHLIGAMEMSSDDNPDEKNDKKKSEKPKKSPRRRDPLVPSLFGTPIEKVCSIVSNSEGESSESYLTQQTDEMECSSSTTGEVLSPLSKLSTGSSKRKVFNFTIKEHEFSSDADESN